MLYVGIDVAKSKHDCCILNVETGVDEHFSFPNSRQGFSDFYDAVIRHQPNITSENTRVGLEATGHYSNNIIDFIQAKNLNFEVFNPLLTNLFRKGQSLRKTKTDKADAKFIATMLMTEASTSYSPISYHMSELKSLSRNRFRLVSERSKLKMSYTRLVDILFPELPSLLDHHSKSIRLVLSEFPTIEAISKCNLSHLTAVLKKGSRGRHKKDMATKLRDLARDSIGSNSAASGLELQQTIASIIHFEKLINDVESKIKECVDELGLPLLSIHGLSYTLTAIIASEIGNIDKFPAPSQLQAFAGIDPSTCQSGNSTSTHCKMVKRGSKYLRWAIMQAAMQVSMPGRPLYSYMLKKRAEGKHYFVALGHVAKKLLRIIFSMLKNNETYIERIAA